MALSTIIILSIFIILAFYFDVRTQKIPNKLILIFAPIAVVNSLLVGGVTGLLFSVGAMFAGGLIMMLLYIFKAIGAGDVKAFAIIGLITNIEFVLYCMFYTIIAGGIIGILILLFTRTFLSRMVKVLHYIGSSIILKSTAPMETFKVTEAKTMPFMIAVLPGAILAFYYVYLS